MDYAKAFTFVFDDEDWVKKVLTGGIVAMIPIVNLIVVGYGLTVLRNVAEGREKALPEWEDFGDYFVQGLMSFLGGLIWAVPIILLLMLMGLISWVTGYEGDPYGVAGPVWLCMSGLSCLSGLYGLFLAAFIPAATTKYAVSRDFAAFFRVAEIFKYITSNLGPYIIALLLGTVAGFIASFGLILCLVGVVFTGFWASLVCNYLLGQVYAAGEA
ncbi:MAG: hypothetical protein AMJ93_03585 [Anaerolineae bacterium SM23_84]|nr:MAG: hypothetical protein AMJ93_03585 [Anaerolineae bacterium SM23_84]